MSIYALPGPLFKLVSNGISSAKPKDAVEVDPSTVKDSSCSESQSSSSSLSVADCAENPLHRRPNCASSSSTSCQLAASMDSNSSSHAGTRRNSNSNVVIAVKQAKIDPERLIRSLSMSGDSKKSSSSKSKPSGDAVSEDKPMSSNAGGQRRRRSKNYSEGNDCCRECDPHEEAIKFEFSVSFNGREYTATRSLPRILQFRYDLIEEFRARQMWRERRRKRKESVPPAMAKVRDVSDDEEEESSIPEIPRLSEDAAGSSGFTMLNALLRPYGPALERWLTKVIDIVPHDSQCLTQFLWEPLSGRAAGSRKELRRKSSSTLVAIQETDDLDQYDSDTDEYLLAHC